MLTDEMLTLRWSRFGLSTAARVQRQNDFSFTRALADFLVSDFLLNPKVQQGLGRDAVTLR